MLCSSITTMYPTATLCVSQYSQLQQQRQYLQHELEDQRWRSDLLTMARKTPEPRLAEHGASDSSPDAIPRRREATRKTRRKVNKCIRVAEYLSAEIANVESQMRTLEHLQWRGPESVRMPAPPILSVHRQSVKPTISRSSRSKEDGAYAVQTRRAWEVVLLGCLSAETSEAASVLPMSHRVPSADSQTHAH